METNSKISSLEKEVAYYKKQLDKLAGDHLRNQYVISKLNTATKEYTNGFQILSEVHHSFSFLKTPEAFHEEVLEALAMYMSVDKVLLLKYNMLDNSLGHYLSKGCTTQKAEIHRNPKIKLPDNFTDGRHTTCVSSHSSLTDFEIRVQEQLGDPYFLLTPLYSNQRFWGALYAGRKQEVKPLYLPFSNTDIYIFESIAGMISSLTYQLEQHEALEKERHRIARDMHDDIGSGLTHIALTTELMQLKQELNGAVKEDISNIATSAGRLVESMSEIIWALNSHNDTLENLVAYLREQTSKFLEPFNATYNIQFPETVPQVKLTSEQKRNIYLVIKEALNNILKHAKADTITMKMDLKDNTLIFRIQDNGKGFDATKNRIAANGLRNMQRRIVDIGGTYDLTTGNKGTLVQFSVPLSGINLPDGTTFFTPSISV